MRVCDFCDDYNYGIKQVAGNDDYNYDKGRYLLFDSLLKGEEPPHTGGGRVFLPRCNPWSSGHTPAPGAPHRRLVPSKIPPGEEKKKKKWR